MERKRQAKADAYLDAAMKVVARDGVDGLTMAALAAELDAAVGALYRYFPGKDELVAALQARALDALVDEMRAARGRRGTLGRVLALLEPFATLADRDPLRHRLLDELLSAPEAVHGDGAARALEAHLAPALALVAAALDDARAAGALAPGDARLRTRALWSALHGVSHLRKRDRLEAAELKAAAVERALLEALLVGFGATSASARATLRRWRRRSPR